MNANDPCRKAQQQESAETLLSKAVRASDHFALSVQNFLDAAFGNEAPEAG